jgi:hypothetical protein
LEQLDLFIDGRDAVLVHEVIRALLVRDSREAASRLGALRHEHREHPDLPALVLLIESLDPSISSPMDHAALTATIDHIEGAVAPAARRLLGQEAVSFLEPLWRGLAAAAAPLRFDETRPRAHASWVGQRVDDWGAVRAAIEAEPDWPSRPLLRYRLGLARHHLGAVDAAIRLWLPLCWVDPSLFARYAPTLPDPRLRDAWEAFDDASVFAEVDDRGRTAWFPSLLLLGHRRLAELFDPVDVPDAGLATDVFRILVALVPLERAGLGDELIAHRRTLQRLSPDVFACYMETMGGRRPARHGEHRR